MSGTAWKCPPSGKSTPYVMRPPLQGPVLFPSFPVAGAPPLLVVGQRLSGVGNRVPVGAGAPLRSVWHARPRRPRGTMPGCHGRVGRAVAAGLRAGRVVRRCDRLPRAGPMPTVSTCAIARQMGRTAGRAASGNGHAHREPARLLADKAAPEQQRTWPARPSTRPWPRAQGPDALLVV